MTVIELDQAQRDLDKAIDTHQSERGKLYRQDGSKRYSDQEHKEREAALLAPVQEAAERARQAAKAILSELGFIEVPHDGGGTRREPSSPEQEIAFVVGWLDSADKASRAVTNREQIESHIQFLRSQLR